MWLKHSIYIWCPLFPKYKLKDAFHNKLHNSCRRWWHDAKKNSHFIWTLIHHSVLSNFIFSELWVQFQHGQTKDTSSMQCISMLLNIKDAILFWGYVTCWTRPEMSIVYYRTSWSFGAFQHARRNLVVLNWLPWFKHWAIPSIF